MKTQNLFYVLALSLILPLSAHAQWSGPTVAPTGGNVSAPINVSATTQSKSGAFTVGSIGVTGGATINGSLGIGTVSPSYPLHVIGNIYSSSGIIATTLWSSDAIRKINTNQILTFRNSAGSAEVTLDGGGNLGIGTTIPSYKLDVNGDVINNGWYRSRGTSGWYNESYGGGWYMQDATWIRSYNAKPVYMSAGLDTGAASGIGCGGGLGGSYMLQVCGAAGVGANAFFYSSDRSLKTNITPLVGSLNKILHLQGVSFDWKGDGGESIGVIAQDVEKVYPELVNTDKKTGLKSVEYGNLVAPLIEAIKEQQKQIDELKAEVQSLKSSR